jgi:hypothetical protein
MIPAFVVTAIVMMGGFAILYRNRAKADAAASAKLAVRLPVQVVWKKSPFLKNHRNPLKCGSLYD